MDEGLKEPPADVAGEHDNRATIDISALWPDAKSSSRAIARLREFLQWRKKNGISDLERARAEPGVFLVWIFVSLAAFVELPEPEFGAGAAIAIAGVFFLAIERSKTTDIVRRILVSEGPDEGEMLESKLRADASGTDRNSDLRLLTTAAKRITNGHLELLTYNHVTNAYNRLQVIMFAQAAIFFTLVWLVSDDPLAAMVTMLLGLALFLFALFRLAAYGSLRRVWEECSQPNLNEFRVILPDGSELETEAGS
ncbi:MAG: hypothetical protein ACKVHO_25615 [Verrucomicrobiia bacterium]